MDGVSQRELLATAGTLAFATRSEAAIAKGPDNSADTKLLASIDGVNTPPLGRGAQKFSFANPEP